ncbi:MAG: glycosyltransferase family 4 protein [bacterium]|nr:glycosyltransferase family 4 protein [bacterium]
MKIKVLHISKMNGVSGSENHLLNLLSGLNKEQFEVHLYILTESRYLPLLQEYTQALDQAGVIVIVRKMQRHFDLSLIRVLRKYMSRENFDIVHTHLIHADLYGTIAAKSAKTPIIISSRHNDDKFRRLTLSIWLNRFLARWQAQIIVISDWIGKFLQDVEKIPEEKIVRIHYGLDPAPILKLADPEYVRQQFNIPAKVPLIGTIGRLTEQKGQEFLLRAVQKVRREFPETRVLLIGDGELREKLETLVKELGIESNVIFAGYRTDALQLLSGFDIFVLPSLWEGFGLVLLEAMALKKAIVASAVSAIPESVLDGKSGILVSPQDNEQVAEALLTLLKEPKLRKTFGMQGYRHLQTHFTVKNMVESTEAMYTQLFAKHTS